MTLLFFEHSVLDSSGKIPDGIFSGSRDFCDYIDEFKLMVEIYSGQEFPFSCDTDFGGVSLSFLRGKISIPQGNTKAWGSLEGCIGVKTNFKEGIDPFYGILPNFGGLWTVQKFMGVESEEEDNFLPIDPFLGVRNAPKPRVAPKFGIIPALPGWDIFQTIWNAIIDNDVRK